MKRGGAGRALLFLHVHIHTLRTPAVHQTYLYINISYLISFIFLLQYYNFITRRTVYIFYIHISHICARSYVTGARADHSFILLFFFCFLPASSFQVRMRLLFAGRSRPKPKEKKACLTNYSLFSCLLFELKSTNKQTKDTGSTTVYYYNIPSTG